MKRFKKWLRWLFTGGRPTVDDIVADLKEKAALLREAEAHYDVESQLIAERINQLRAEQGRAYEEAARAGRIAANVEKLLDAAPEGD